MKHESIIHISYRNTQELTPYKAKQGKHQLTSSYGQKNNIINELSHVHHAILAMHNKNWTNKKLPEKLFNITDS